MGSLFMACYLQYFVKTAQKKLPELAGSLDYQADIEILPYITQDIGQLDKK